MKLLDVGPSKADTLLCFSRSIIMLLEELHGLTAVPGPIELREPTVGIVIDKEAFEDAVDLLAILCLCLT